MGRMLEIAFWAKEYERWSDFLKRSKQRARHYGIESKEYLEYLEKKRHELELKLRKLISETCYAPLLEINGLGPATVGLLIAYTRDNKRVSGKEIILSEEPKPFRNFKAISKFFGLHGDQVKKPTRGQKLDYNLRAKSVLIRFVYSPFLQGVWKQLYLRELQRSKQNVKHKDWTEGHHKAHARRKVAREVLREFWRCGEFVRQGSSS